MKQELSDVYAELQSATDQLLAMYLAEHRFVLPAQLTVLDLINWASQKSQQGTTSYAKCSELSKTS